MKLTIVKAAPAGVYLLFAGVLYIWHVGAALLGAYIADRLGVSDGSFDPKHDVKKMGLCSLIALTLFFSLFYFAQSPVVLMVYLLTFMVSLKFAYLGSNHGFLLIILGATLMGMVVFVPVVLWLRLPGVLLLYLAGFIALRLRRHAAAGRALDLQKIAAAKERRLRDLARRDPDFTTFCYQCLFYRPDVQRCQLRLDGKEVREIKLGHRALCTSFQPDRAGELQAK